MRSICCGHGGREGHKRQAVEVWHRMMQVAEAAFQVRRIAQPNANAGSHTPDKIALTWSRVCRHLLQMREGRREPVLISILPFWVPPLPVGSLSNGMQSSRGNTPPDRSHG